MKYVEETEEASDGSGKRKRYTNNHDHDTRNRKRRSGSSRADSDDNNDQLKKRVEEESALHKLSTWYQDGDLDNNNNVDKTGHLDPHNRTRTPDMTAKLHQDSQNSHIHYERSSSFKRNDLENDVYKDHTFKGRDDTWNDRNKDHESSKEISKRRRPNSIDRDSKGDHSVMDHNRDCQLPRHGVDMNIMGVPSAVSPLTPGPSGPRFSAPNIGNSPNPAMYYNQSGPGRGIPPSIVSPGFNPTGQMTRGTPPDKPQGGWVPPNSGILLKAPSRGEQDDYSQNFVDTGMRPQNFIRELELTSVVEDYPKLRELITKKDEIVTKSASAPMYYKCDLKEFEMSPEFFGTKFDVILVDPPWEEYVHRAPGVADHMDYWTFEEIMNLKIEAIADIPSFIFLWVGDGVGLEQGRQCLKKWGFRRCEDICWIKTNKGNATPGLRHDSHTLFQHSKEHCLMGIKGAVRRSTDGHIIHANIDTDVLIAEEPPYG
ncbi:putative mRNA (2'-O-methyladenosine-N(6)-)-methyltransferase [Lupinus albus]|uniref:Putative mRNA (2'-O-methyladenosine-N(6)-)-methyltransferase n=1 Tax=Lupinus albus TaxID=3870 RepID=A0A6A4NHX2_LUPAL|nr:putative mRNA (2'-O-methyladenosine-N(6)-)-methyltransferase [Lupinus albus]